MGLSAGRNRLARQGLIYGRYNIQRQRRVWVALQTNTDRHKLIPLRLPSSSPKRCNRQGLLHSRIQFQQLHRSFCRIGLLTSRVEQAVHLKSPLGLQWVVDDSSSRLQQDHSPLASAYHRGGHRSGSSDVAWGLSSTGLAKLTVLCCSFSQIEV